MPHQRKEQTVSAKFEREREHRKREGNRRREEGVTWPVLQRGRGEH